MAKKMEALNRTLKSTEEKLAKEKRAAEEARKEEERADREFWEGEQKKHADKLKLAEDIFRWGREFSQSEEYKRLLKLVPPVDIGTKGSLHFYGGGWGHKRKETYGCWSRLYLQRDGTFYYGAGYKWMPTGPKFFFNTPKEMAKLSERYLNKVHQFIVTGEVYESLRKEVNGFFKITKGHHYSYKR